MTQGRHHLSPNWRWTTIGMGRNFRVNLTGGAFGTQPQLCRDRGGILGGPTFECQLPHGHTGIHRFNDAICWDRT